MYSFRPGVRRRGLVAGDGFLKNIGKAIKKIQPGKILGKVANIASPILGSVPIVGGLYKAALAVGKASGDPRYANVDPGTGYIGGSQSMASTAATTASSTGSSQGLDSGMAKRRGNSMTSNWHYDENGNAVYNTGPGKGARGIGPMLFRRRRTNPLNPRALRRSISRLRQFERFAKSALVVHNFRKVGHIRVGHARRSK